MERGVFAFACQYIASLCGRTDNRTITQMRHPHPCRRTTKVRATISCQYSVGTYPHSDIVLASPSPRKCRYPPLGHRLLTPRLNLTECRRPPSPMSSRTRKGTCGKPQSNDKNTSVKKRPAAAAASSMDDKKEPHCRCMSVANR